MSDFKIDDPTQGSLIIKTDCTCGSGGHPRRCEIHPDYYDLHVMTLNYENARDEIADLKAELEAAKRENERLECENGRRLQALINVQDYLRSIGRSMPSIVEIIKESRGLSVNESGNRKEMAEVDALSAPSPREPIMNETARNARIRARRKS